MERTRTGTDGYVVARLETGDPLMQAIALQFSPTLKEGCIFKTNLGYG